MQHFRVMSCRGDHCHDGGQLCKERRLSSAAQRVPSLCFTAPLSHIVPFRAQTVHPPCSGHPTIVRASWFEKPSGFFFFFKSRRFAFVSVSEILQVDWDRRISNMPKGVFLFITILIILLSFLCWPLSCCDSPNFPSSLQQYSLFDWKILMIQNYDEHFASMRQTPKDK